MEKPRAELLRNFDGARRPGRPERSSAADTEAAEARRGSTKPARHGGSSKSQSQQSATETSGTVPFRRATYYLRPEQIKAMKLRAVSEERDLSELVRDAFDQYLKRG